MQDVMIRDGYLYVLTALCNPVNEQQRHTVLCALKAFGTP